VSNQVIECKYCGAEIKKGTICSSCYKKLKLIRKLQAMVRNAKEIVERSKHNESMD
jgi:hypothetical protein